MKKEAGILLAGGIGLLAALSFIGIKKILEKKQKKYKIDMLKRIMTK